MAQMPDMRGNREIQRRGNGGGAYMRPVRNGSNRLMHYMTPKDITKIRENLGLSQMELGLLIGASERTIRDWECETSKSAVRHAKKPMNPPCYILLQIMNLHGRKWIEKTWQHLELANHSANE